MKKTIVLSVFPACGKTYMVENCNNLKILDSDSSNFSWKHSTDLSTRERDPNFPNNYIEHIKENIGKYDYIFVSSHDVVRQALDEAGIEYDVVFPSRDMLDEWIGRCYRRKNNGFPIQVLIDNWDEWINGMLLATNDHGYAVLGHNEYLSDCIPVDYNDSNRKTIEVNGRVY